jgi:hypothetical protein
MQPVTFAFMLEIQGGSKIKDIATGFCIVGSLLNPVVGGACAVFALGDWAGWW